MKQKQNIANTLLLLGWAAMFCFAVLFTLHKPAPQVYTSISSQHQENLTPEAKTIPLAWIEPTASETVSEQVKSYLQIFSSICWFPITSKLFSSAKPNKSLSACAFAIIRYLVQPNAP